MTAANGSGLGWLLPPGDEPPTADELRRLTCSHPTQDVAHRHLYVVQEGRAWRSTEPIPWCAACRAPLQDRVDVVEVTLP